MASSARTALRSFTPAVREWFMRAFATPTEAQAQAWPAIATGEHVLISAPTGSGKTLAAFLWALDRLAASPLPEGERRTRLIYVSPLKALSYDIERNLRAPLQGIAPDGGISVAIRTGDTPQRERAAMVRNPPDVLITTPESLYLMLTSRAREILTGAEWVILDEIHAVAGTKRGAHMALTLERLDALVGEAEGRAGVQRIGLSATQNPLEEVGRFMVGPRRRCRIVDTGVRKPLDLQIHVPVESMVEPEQTPDVDPLDPVAGGEATRRSIWPAIYPELLRLVQEHRSTIIFVNNRRSAERLALRLNELANEPPEGEDAEGEDARRAVLEIARAHHGSLAREERLVVEEQLKAGAIPCIVATSSLELGIDMGAVDLVLQVESPKSVAAGLQRIGRAGHNVGDTSKGRIFPKFRADLLECAVVAQRMREGAIEPTVVPRNPLDVLAQQVVAMAAAEEELNVDELYARVTRTHSYGELGRQQLENVLDMLDGRYPSSEFAELRPRIVWDRIAGVVRPRRGARQLAVTNAGTIPDRGLYMVTLPDGRRVGELDEEMVYEARPGQVFLLGASSWRIEEIGRDRVIVTPAPGVPGAVPFWKGDGIGRPKELGEAIGAFSRWAVEQSAERLAASHDLDPRAARNLLDFLREQQEATRVIPSDRTIVVERFRDEIGDWRLCILSPYGGRIHAAWGLALSAKIRDELGLEADAIWSDDGIIVHLPDADEPPGAEFALIEPDALEDAVVAELSSSALFGARFRENAGRALLIPRAYPGKRTPLWQQRLKSQNLLEVAKRYGEFPIILETYRECLRDVLDLPGLRELLTQLQRRELSLVEVETQTASPFASSLLFDYVATYMYEGDTPNAERRAAALSLDRDLLRELLGQEELRDLIDADALDQVEDDLQQRSERTRATTKDELHDVLRRVGDLTAAEAAQRVAPNGRDTSGAGARDDGRDAAAAAEAWLAELERERRAVRVRVGGEPRWIDAADAGLYRDALGVVPPGGLPEAFVANVPDALLKLLRRYAQTHGPFTTDEPRARFGLDPTPALRALERDGEIVRGELRPGGISGTREWCDSDVLRRLRRASLAVLRREIEPADQRAFATFLPSWQGVDKHPPGGAGIDRLREQLVPLQGLALTPSAWENEVLPRRVGAYSTTWIDQLCASGELVWVGAGALGRTNGKVALYFRDDAALIGPPPIPGRAPPLDLPEHLAVRERLAQGSCFFTDLLVDLSVSPEQIQEALWDLAWAGEVTNDAFSPLRAPRMTLVRAQRRAAARAGRPGRFSSRRGAGRAELQGRWSLTEPLFRPAPGVPSDPSAKRRALGELLLERYGIVTRELVLAEGVPGGFSALYPELSQLETLGVARRGYFVEGLGGAQFALPGAVERLRAQRAPEESAPIVLAATDPAQPFGAALPWPKRDGETRRPARVPGATVVIAGAEPVVYLERGGKALQVLSADDDARVMAALLALADHTRAGRIRRIALEKVNGESVMGTRWEAMLAEVGFSAGPRRLTLTA
ncbi:DEAD/DEAH box helicase [Conexibacter sp. JD483]|uniref:DEAD/DEAH box helicase n=1 Tax=unclassified Conexibacter TaxID=2627773 RepID=UPI002726F4E7|nr:MULTISPECIES: DEAD/DEAH box helicase [unclassified Conexibacter]MDO8184265.1 DEAD/DEAH box helicase [Conexibacter sp. CPCC 205706]MDO8197571.1 DEAD/DEAH box helicase [Conexibacter sp. CPCC 205762]MDR9371052.1 DEAD/DEAH box helicase [Conexibacter sp. JD483]